MMGRDITQKAVVPKHFGQVVHRKSEIVNVCSEMLMKILGDKAAVGGPGLAAARKSKLE